MFVTYHDEDLLFYRNDALPCSETGAASAWYDVWKKG